MSAALVTALLPLTSRVRTDATAVRGADGTMAWTREPLTEKRLLAHVTGGVARGCCPIKAGQNTTRVGVFDLDSHKGEVPWPDMAAVASRLCDVLVVQGFMPVPFRSGGGSGIHIYLIWDEDQDAYSVRRTMIEAVEALDHKSGTGGLGLKQIEVFPKQNAVAPDKFGNMFVLPLSRASVPLSPTFAPLPRESAVTIEWPVSTPVPLAAAPEKTYQSSGHTPIELRALEAALAAIPQETAPLVYDDWFHVMCGIDYETGGSDDGLALAHRFSERAGGKHDPDFLDNRVWPYLHNDRDTAITGKSIFHMARGYGYVEDVTDDFDVVHEDIASVEVKTKRNKFQPVHASTFTDAPETKWLVKGVLPAGDQAAVLAVMYGASGSGKSFQATDMACAIARGIPWREHRVTQGRVVYVCAEGAGGYRKRLRAYCKHHGLQIADLDVWVIPAAPNLLQGDDVRALITALLSIGPLGLVIVDTLAQATAGGNENSGEDMGKAIGHCRTISEVLHCTVMLVHHSGKDDTKGARGHSSLKAAADTELEVLRSEKDKDMRVMRVSKQKDGEEVPDMGFGLHVVELGKDADGDPITSCVVVTTTATVADIRANSTKGKGPQQVLIISTLEDMQGLCSGETVPFEDLVSAVVAKLPAPKDDKEDRRARQTRMKIHKLIEDGLLTTSNGCVGAC